MENVQNACCNSSESLVTIPVSEYRELEYEKARNDIVRHLLMNEPTSYVCGDTIRIVLGLRPAQSDSRKGENDE